MAARTRNNRTDKPTTSKPSKPAASKPSKPDATDTTDTTTDEPTPDAEPTATDVPTDADGGSNASEGTDEPTTDEPTPDPVDVFRAAVLAAVDATDTTTNPPTVEPAALAAAVVAFHAVPRKQADTVRADVVVSVSADAFAAGKPERAHAASVVGNALAAAAAERPTGNGPSTADVVGARVAALAALATDVVADALVRFGVNADDAERADVTNALTTALAGTDVPVTLTDALVGYVDAVLVATADDDDDDATATGVARGRDGAAWRNAFGGKRPDVDKLPGRRSGGTGGGGRSAGRSLADVADGTVVTYTVGGAEHTATVAGSKLTTADGREHGTPSGAARHVNGGTSVNGWLAAWKLPDGRPLAAAVDADEPADEPTDG